MSNLILDKVAEARIAKAQKEIDAKNQYLTEFVLNRFKHIMSFYGSLESSAQKSRVGEALKSIKFFAHEAPANIDVISELGRPWPFLDAYTLNRDPSVQKRLRDEEKVVMDNDDKTAVSTFDQPYVYVDFGCRFPITSAVEDLDDVSHATIMFKLAGDTRGEHYFDSSEDNIINASFVAGDGTKGKRAFLTSTDENGNCAVYELDRFCILYLSAKDDNSETGAFILFNKNLNILYASKIEGSPNLKSAKLPFIYGNNAANDDKDTAPSPDLATDKTETTGDDSTD